jgi:hypothetical protein
MAVVNRNASIEFIVKPKQDLYLEGSLRRLPRVGKGSFVYLNFDAALDRQLFIRNTNCGREPGDVIRRSVPLSNAEEPNFQLFVPPLCEAQWPL